jgi:hypothetical protein
LIQELDKCNPDFSRLLNDRVHKVLNSTTIAEREEAVVQIKRNLAGQLGEIIVTDGFRPYFKNIETQLRVPFPNGDTIVDLRCLDARDRIIFGPGKWCSQGQNVSIEAKTGKSSYFSSELSHILDRQVPGHIELGDNSLVVVSKNFHDLSNEASSRELFKQAGSYVMALLPPKETLDSALTDEVMRMCKERQQI